MSTTFLELIINDTLTLDDHIRTVFNKFSRSIVIIHRIANQILKSILVSLYFSLVHPYFEYCKVI